MAADHDYAACQSQVILLPLKKYTKGVGVIILGKLGIEAA